MNINRVQSSGYTAPAAAVKAQEKAKQDNEELVTRRPAAEDVFIPSKKDTESLPSTSRLSAEAVKSLREHAEQTINSLAEKMIRAQKKHAETAGLDLSTLAQAMGLGSEAGIGDIQALVNGLHLDTDVSGMSYGDIAETLGIGTTPESAARAISDEGMWGVNAVSTRLLDMAMSLSVGDTDKIGTLRDAVKKGFEAVGDLDSLPQVCQDTYAETMARFDYWEANGSLEGYGQTE